MMSSCGPYHTDEQVVNDKQELINNSSIGIQDVVLRTCCMRWTIEKNGGRKFGKSVLVIRYDDNDDIYICTYICVYIYIYIQNVLLA